MYLQEATQNAVEIRVFLTPLLYTALKDSHGGSQMTGGAFKLFLCKGEDLNA